jgi:hypothetical protein
MLVFAFSAKAGNEGAQAAPQPQDPVLAEYIAAGGFFVPPGSVASKQYQILQSGTVQLVSWIRGEQSPKVETLKQLSTEELALCNNLVEAIEPGELVDPNPESPGCMDAPSFRYVVHSSKGEITIWEKFNCKVMDRPAATEADSAIMKILSDIVDSEESRMSTPSDR